MKFTLTDQERYALGTFLEEHGSCTESGLAFETSSSSGIGPTTIVTCECGGSTNITDYSVW